MDDHYTQRWDEHIDELTRLGFHLDEADRRRVSELQDELKEIVEVAAENGRREELNGVLDAERKHHVEV